MGPDEGTLDELKALLKECSAHLVSEEGRGTGFFVDHHHLLTCGHVVGYAKGTEVQVQPYGRSVREGRVIEVLPEGEDDLALLELVEMPDDEEPPPAVVCELSLPDGIDYYAVGYPREEFEGEGDGLEGIEYKGHARLPPDGGAPTVLRLEAGRSAVTSGMSGGPVLNTRTGAVVGMVRYSAEDETAGGGGAIPIERAIDRFDLVGTCYHEPPTATRRWRDALGAVNWQALGYRWGWERMLEVKVSGNRDGWRVQVDPDDDVPHEVTTEGLPRTVFKALFKWAERRHVRSAEEVGLLGQLLTSAVFPSGVASRLLDERLADELLLRLHFEGNSDLFDVPWEFVSVETNGEDRHLAAREGLGLVRVGAHPDPGTVVTAPFEGEGRVVGIVLQPDDWQSIMPRVLYSGSAVRWPDPSEIMGSLKAAVEGPGELRFAPLESPTAKELSEALAEPLEGKTSLEVVHYLGFGNFENGRAFLALSDGYGAVYWRAATDVFKWVADSGARVFVAELMHPPPDRELEPIPARTFLGALGGRVNAVVFTRFPVHPREFNPFNETLYEALSAGESIEAAVQRARKALDDLQALGDAAGFGAFTLITGERADLRLRPVAVSTPLKSGAQQQRRDTARDAQAGAAARGQTMDKFGR
jgi:Trypsin-like peptidase domain